MVRRRVGSLEHTFDRHTCSRVGLSRLAGPVALAGLVLGSSSAHAQTVDGYRAERFRPPATPDDGLAMPRPSTVGHLVPAFGLVVDYAYQPLVARSSLGGDASAVVAHRVVTHVIAALGVTDRLELHLRAPIVVQVGDAPVVSEIALGAPDVVSVADGVLGGSLRLVGEGSQGFHLGLTGEVLFPFASAQSYVSDREVSGRGLLTASMALPTMTLSLAAGASYRPERPLFGTRSASELDLAVGLGVPAFLRTELAVELLVSTGLRDELLFQTRGTSLELVLGARHRLESGLAIELGGGVGFLRAPGTPTFQVFAGVRWASPPAGPTDEDGDGLVGDDDRCPTEPEDLDHNYDTDGCPELDDDDDGVPDASDRCPRDAEDRDAWDDDDGCPDPDDDDDGWGDVEDACPRIPGGDSRRGCPRVLRVELVPGEPMSIALLEDLAFVDGAAQLLPIDGVALDELAAVLRSDRTGVRLRVEVRAERVSRRDDGAALALERAQAVVAALVNRGVPSMRLEAAVGGAPDRLVTVTTLAGPSPRPTPPSPR